MNLPLDQGQVSLPDDNRFGHSWSKRMDVVAMYMLLGNLRVVSEQTGVSYATLVDWKKSDWWPDMVDQIKRQRKGKTNSSLTKIIEQSLDVMQDRLENGDYILNNKTGEIVRKPVGVREATTIATNLLQRQIQLEELAEKSEKTSDSVNETLALLAKEFQKWNTKQKRNNATDIEYAIHDQRQERLQEGSGEIYEPSGSGEEASGTEQSPQDDGESGQSTER